MPSLLPSLTQSQTETAWAAVTAGLHTLTTNGPYYQGDIDSAAAVAGSAAAGSYAPRITGHRPSVVFEFRADVNDDSSPEVIATLYNENDIKNVQLPVGQIRARLGGSGDGGTNIEPIVNEK